MNDVTKKHIQNIILYKMQDLSSMEQRIARLEQGLADENKKRNELINEIKALEKDLNN